MSANTNFPEIQLARGQARFLSQGLIGELIKLDSRVVPNCLTLPGSLLSKSGLHRFQQGKLEPSQCSMEPKGLYSRELGEGGLEESPWVPVTLKELASVRVRGRWEAGLHRSIPPHLSLPGSL